MAHLKALPDWLEAPKFDQILDRMYQGVGWGEQLLNQLNLGQSLDSAELTDFILSLQEESDPTPPPPRPMPDDIEDSGRIPEPGKEKVSRPNSNRGGFHKAASSNASAIMDNAVRVSGTKLDELLAASTELLVARLRIRQHGEEIAGLLAEGQTWLRLWRSVRSSHTRLVQRATVSNKTARRDNDLNNLLHFAEVSQQRLQQLETNLSNLHARFTRDVSYLSFVTDQLQFETRRLRLIPLTTVMEELEIEDWLRKRQLRD